MSIEVAFPVVLWRRCFPLLRLFTSWRSRFLSQLLSLIRSTLFSLWSHIVLLNQWTSWCWTRVSLAWAALASGLSIISWNCLIHRRCATMNSVGSIPTLRMYLSVKWSTRFVLSPSIVTWWWSIPAMCISNGDSGPSFVSCCNGYLVGSCPYLCGCQK